AGEQQGEVLVAPRGARLEEREEKYEEKYERKRPAEKARAMSGFHFFPFFGAGLVFSSAASLVFADRASLDLGNCLISSSSASLASSIIFKRAKQSEERK